MRNGESVAAFERAFAEYVGAKYAIALCNGTATLHTALVALGVKPGDRVAVPPLTMSATTIAVLHAGAVPVFVDVDPHTWLFQPNEKASECRHSILVSLYGLCRPAHYASDIDDAAQTLRKHSDAAFTSYSFQASKILALGEGGMLVTNDEALATRAREFSSLGYRMRADQPRIDPAVLKSPTFERHHTYPAFNYRMSDLVAAEGLRIMHRTSSHYDLGGGLDELLALRAACAALYRDAIAGCDWLTPQRVPEGWTHDYWSWTVALGDAMISDGDTLTAAFDRAVSMDVKWEMFAQTIVRNGGERPYAAWRLTYQEPAFADYARPAGATGLFEPLDGRWYFHGKPQPTGLCPIAEDLQPRLMQFQTNNLASAERNAEALRKAIREIGG